MEVSSSSESEQDSGSGSENDTGHTLGIDLGSILESDAGESDKESTDQDLDDLDSSTLYTTWPHNVIKNKLVYLIERTFQRESSLYIACNDRNAFFTSDAVRNYNLWSCQKVCEALTFLLDNIYIRFGSKLYRQIVGIPMGTNCTLQNFS